MTCKVVPESIELPISGLDQVDGEWKGVEEGKKKGIEKDKDFEEGKENVGVGKDDIVDESDKVDLTKNEATSEGFREDIGGAIEDKTSGNGMAGDSQPVDPQKNDVPSQSNGYGHAGT